MLQPLFIAGPCVIESAEVLDVVAQELARLRDKYGLNEPLGVQVQVQREDIFKFMYRI